MNRRFDFAMSSKISKKENGSSPIKQTSSKIEITNKKSSSSEASTAVKNSSFLSVFQNSSSKEKVHKQNNILDKTADESLSKVKLKEKGSLKYDNKESSNKLYNSTQPTDSDKMVVSFQSGNSGANHSLTNNSISCRSNNSALNFSASTSGSRAGKPAAGKVLKNGSSGNSMTKDSGMNKKKVEKGLEHCATNGSSKTSNGTKHHSSSHEDNQHRTSRSAGNSRNNSGGNNIKCDKKEIIDMEHSSVSTDSSTHSSNSTASKLSKIGRRLRDSCRNLRGKHSSGGSSSHEPQDYTSIQPPNESLRSKNYVPMDFSGREGRICDLSDVPGNQPTDKGYTYFRRKCLSGNVKNLLTETQSNIHKNQPWYHIGVGRDASQKILATHAVDGAFLVRESSVSGGFVISYYVNGRTHHAQALPDVVDNCVTYSIDDGRTRFFDLLQMVEYYQLNRGSLSTRLIHYIVSLEAAETFNEGSVSQKKAISCSDPEVNMKSNIQDNQDLSLDSNLSENISSTSGTEIASMREESNAKHNLNGGLTSPDDVTMSRQNGQQMSPESEANNKAEFSVSDPSTPNFQFSKDPLYPQSSGEQSIDTSKPGADSSFELSQNGMNGADNVCDQNKTTNDESNNNNNNMKSAKKSKLSSEDEKSKDNIENSIMEDSNDFPLVYKKEDPNLKNGISDCLELKEYEKEKCPQGHD